MKLSHLVPVTLLFAQMLLAAEPRTLEEALLNHAWEWTRAPKPPDILTFLREDVLDEAAKSAKSSPEAYKLASDYCDKLLAALGQRERARVHAGYAAAQADVKKQRLKVEWAARAEQMRTHLDNTYRQLREALR